MQRTAKIIFSKLLKFCPKHLIFKLNLPNASIKQKCNIWFSNQSVTKKTCLTHCTVYMGTSIVKS